MMTRHLKGPSVFLSHIADGGDGLLGSAWQSLEQGISCFHKPVLSLVLRKTPGKSPETSVPMLDAEERLHQHCCITVQDFH